MNLFQYKAVTETGRTVVGRIEAHNEADLELRLARMGLDVIRYRVTRPRQGWLRRHRIGRRELISFCFHLEQLSRAGVPILEGLDDLRDSTDNARFREVLATLIESIEGGQTLSQALGHFPAIFSPIFINLIRAGEHSGRLADVLRELTETLKWQDELAAQTRKIVTYPAFVGLVVLGVTVFLMTYLVPQLASFMKSLGQELPWQTRGLILVSDTMVRYWYLALAIPPLALLTLRWLTRRNPAIAYRIDGLKLRLPAIGPVLQKIIMARFSGNFALMYGAGIPILECLRISQALIQNRVIEEALERVQQQIGEGEGLSAAFANTGLFPRLVVRMLRVGEGSGALDEALTNITYFYKRDVRESIEKVQSLVEPVLTVVLGAILAWVMFAVLGPVYNSISNMRM